MSKINDLTGHKFLNWTVIERSKKNTKSGSAQWIVECRCGTRRKKTVGDLKRCTSGKCGQCFNPGLTDKELFDSLDYTRRPRYMNIEITLPTVKEVAERITTNISGMFNTAYVPLDQIEELQEKLLLKHNIETKLIDDNTLLVNLNR